MQQVITYASSREQITLSLKQVDRFRALGTWPKDRFGEEMASAIHGLHWGAPTKTDAQLFTDSDRLPTLTAFAEVTRLATFNLGEMIGCTTAINKLHGEYRACTADGTMFELTKAQRDSLLRQVFHRDSYP